jgi:predicted SAM-dependent methyltransferase
MDNDRVGHSIRSGWRDSVNSVIVFSMRDKLRRILLFAFNHRFLALARWEFHFQAIRLWGAVTAQRGRIRRDVATRVRPLFVNLGSGPRGHNDPHWVNVDGFRDEAVRYLIDFTRPLPFDSASVEGVFCEHVVEHFSFDDGIKLAAEVHRILRPGGCFRVVVPDAELVMRRYFDAPDELVARCGVAGETAMEVVNTYFRQRYEHQFLYDWATMEKMLRSAGFDRIVRAAFDRSSLCEPLVLDDKKYEWESLYVEAQRF